MHFGRTQFRAWLICALSIAGPASTLAQVPAAKSKQDSIARSDSIARADSIALVKQLEKELGQQSADTPTAAAT